MKTALQHTAVYFLVAMLVLATGGFSIYEHFCSCAGESRASVFLETTCSNDNEAENPSCCHHDPAPACCSMESTGHAEHSCQHDDCCRDTETFLKISDNFTVSMEKLSFKAIYSLVQVLCSHELLASPHFFLTVPTDFNDMSPPLFGRELLQQLHQLKLGYFLA